MSSTLTSRRSGTIAVYDLRFRQNPSMAGHHIFVALLRGINVGGKNKVSMPELRSLLESMGLENVASYVQSGNVVFRSAAGDARRLAAQIEQRVGDEFGVRPKVLMRTPAELDAIVGRNPYLSRASDLSKLHVVFLGGKTSAGKAAELDPKRSPPDEFSLDGREIYLHLPNGAARTKLTIDYFERRLGTDATARNWKTLVALQSLARRSVS